jgi:hypothetical protein
MTYMDLSPDEKRILLGSRLAGGKIYDMNGNQLAKLSPYRRFNDRVVLTC